MPCNLTFVADYRSAVTPVLGKMTRDSLLDSQFGENGVVFGDVGVASLKISPILRGRLQCLVWVLLVGRSDGAFDVHYRGNA